LSAGRRDRPTRPASPESLEELRQALTDVVSALTNYDKLGGQTLEKAKALLDCDSGGLSAEVLLQADRPTVGDLLGEMTAALAAANGRLRRAEAATLYTSGCSMTRIAGHFGVTRQRVAHLLQTARALEGPGDRRR
jgi:hypothetical protein